MKPLISLVIPVYNVEKYFAKCMDSVLAQTYDNFEVVLVDDGSTDNSGKMCDEYAYKDRRVIVYHKPNGGLSEARNYGVQHANADLISFVDSDDYISEDYLAYLYELLEKYGADLACANSRTVFSDQKEPYCSGMGSMIDETLLNTEEALERICYTSVGADTKLYRKEFLLKHPYPEGRLYEDLATTYKIIDECKFIAFSDKVLYFWVQRKGSILHGEFSNKQYDIFWAADMQLQYIMNKYPRITVAAKARYIIAGMAILDILFSQIIVNKKQHFKRIRNYIKPYIWTVITKSNLKLHTKVACLVVWLGYFPSQIIWMMKKEIKALTGKSLE